MIGIFFGMVFSPVFYGKFHEHPPPVVVLEVEVVSVSVLAEKSFGWLEIHPTNRRACKNEIRKVLRLMAEILHQLIGSLSHYL